MNVFRKGQKNAIEAKEEILHTGEPYTFESVGIIATFKVIFVLVVYVFIVYWVYTDQHCFILWAIQKYIAPAARPIRRINSLFPYCPTRKDNTESITFRN